MLEYDGFTAGKGGDLNLFPGTLDPNDLAAISYRLKHGGSYKKQAIAKAVGANPKRKLKIIDATCGFGSDTIILAYLNCQVFAIEQNIMIAQFFNQRLNAIKQDPFLASIIPNIKLFTGNCLEVIPTIISQSNFFPDVIYLDPMFHHKKTAAPNKLIQEIQKILSWENNSTLTAATDQALFKNIAQFAVKRIVVKRAMKASALSEIKPSFVIKGKASRFDVYLNLKGV